MPVRQIFKGTHGTEAGPGPRAGQAATRDADGMKAAVEAEFAERFNPAEFAELRRLRKRIAEDAGSSGPV
ncbi:hypothetical protein [Hoeflea prorocentri]|uniref:Uncharacterized protein n=1 Tax=Hoeflea prorocentri TaxID=1922333 RepID=A0A9X3UDQ0_9HYPH|nr:hypothetical protein [Hoeflea prorocentri]MCY6379518.1 hypothetical protein [Hoeflea prorocentri]MDA5397318.1 hypothetical protein [Hoeflea prorocentri]